MKMLVKLDPVTHSYLTIDEVKAKRLAAELIDFIKSNIDPHHDLQGIWRNMIPLCEKVLHNAVQLPFPYPDVPLKYAAREGLLPEDFEELYSSFINVITGTATELHGDVVIDGELYTYVDFECAS